MGMKMSIQSITFSYKCIEQKVLLLFVQQSAQLITNYKEEIY